MDPASALLAGLTAGLLIAVQVGPVSLLIVETSVRRGPRTGVAAGLGVATADLAVAAIAAAAGGAAGAALARHETEIHVVAALALAAIALTGLAGALRGDDGEAADVAAGGTPRAHYARCLAITIANPLTIASFAAVAAALSLGGPFAAVAFTAGVGAASAAWHLVLGGAAGHAGRWMTRRGRRALMIGGRLGVLALAAHMVFAV